MFAAGGGRRHLSQAVLDTFKFHEEENGEGSCVIGSSGQKLSRSSQRSTLRIGNLLMELQFETHVA